MEATIHVTSKKAVEVVGAACLATEGALLVGWLQINQTRQNLIKLKQNINNTKTISRYYDIINNK